MNWMELEDIKNKIISLRRKTMNSDLSPESLDFTLKSIEAYVEKAKCIDVQDEFLNVSKILKIESQILNWIFTAIYTSNPSEKALQESVVQESTFDCSDYITAVNYYAEDFKEISFLAKFYVEEFTAKNKSLNN